MTDADLPGSQSSHMGIFEDVCLYSTIFASSPVLPVLPEAGETRINLLLPISLSHYVNTYLSAEMGRYAEGMFFMHRRILMNFHLDQSYVDTPLDTLVVNQTGESRLLPLHCQRGKGRRPATTTKTCAMLLSVVVLK